MTPPLREAGDRAALLDGLRTGDVTTYASDHCHLRLDRDKLPVQGDFTKVPTGMPGIGARLPLAFALGGDHPLAVERVVDAACTKPARIFGLERKGAVAPGLDADLVVWDPRAPSRLSLETMNDGLDWTPYDGIEVPGRVRDVLTRGERVVVDGEWAGEEHRGEYLPVGRVRQTA
jgi:dihydropyrimidinase